MLERWTRDGTLPAAALCVGRGEGIVASEPSVVALDENRGAAGRTVGAEVMVDAVRIDPDDVEALAARPGVGSVVAAHVAPGANLVSGRRAVPVMVIGADPAAYAALLADTPLRVGALPAASGSGLTLLAGPGVPTDGDLELAVRGARLPVDRLVVDPGLARLGAGQALPAVLVPLDRLTELVPSAQPDTAFLSADAAAADALAALRDLSTATPSGRVTGIDTVAAAEERVAGRALPRLVTRTYLAGALLAGALTLLAVVLLLVAILWTIASFRIISGVAAGLMLPYLAWVTFATALNAGIYVLNG